MRERKQHVLLCQEFIKHVKTKALIHMVTLGKEFPQLDQ